MVSNLFNGKIKPISCKKKLLQLKQDFELFSCKEESKREVIERIDSILKTISEIK